jgi:putative copper resistance protein D
VPYTAASIARGAPLFAEHCASCHGPYGRGDGPAAASLALRPTDLTAHWLHHREGDMLWWLEHGIAGTPMPGFGERIGESGLWDLLNFLRAQSAAEEGRTMNASVEPWRPIAAPDFVFQIDRRGQESLQQLRGRNVVLLVFYTLPGSLERLRALAAAASELERLGVRVVALPIKQARTQARDARELDAAMMAEPDSSIVAAYAMFHRSAGGAAPAHIEFLIDRQGYLRARWTPGEAPGWDPLSELLRQVEILNREKPRAPAPRRHVH